MTTDGNRLLHRELLLFLAPALTVSAARTTFLCVCTVLVHSSLNLTVPFAHCLLHCTYVCACLCLSLSGRPLCHGQLPVSRFLMMCPHTDVHTAGTRPVDSANIMYSAHLAQIGFLYEAFSGGARVLTNLS